MAKETSKQTVQKIPVIAPKTKKTVTAILIVVVLLYGLAAVQTSAYPDRIVSGLPIIVEFVVQDLIPPNWGYYKTVLEKLMETWNIALLATTLAAIVCLPFSFLAASNITTSKIVYNVTRFFLNILRTIPELVLAVILVGLVGIGALAGILALFIFSLGILAKLISETIEAVDPGPLEAIRATGGNIVQVIWYGVLPQILPHYASYTLYVLEINVRASVVLGFVGAGGIGMILRHQLNYFNYDNVSMIILMTFIAVTIIDTISSRIRERLV
ncbi:phosphonate ABC transporter permease [Caldalkalibacillus thermarum]|uniref:phosphonate ABC transporter, permease protein PhnE n=1 Tax=Caldalkalibacillus thermarum TaxID=296745 RepID=UPI00166B9B33|nr:phosphonate ABC transporter, permease protein PhnE [Caldalkalibacillus thermarum]GGK20499.1 phosphonate ABC transporter permease [Caldalkalibacillus thermarum]